MPLGTWVRLLEMDELEGTSGNSYAISLLIDEFNVQVSDCGVRWEFDITQAYYLDLGVSGSLVQTFQLSGLQTGVIVDDGTRYVWHVSSGSMTTCTEDNYIPLGCETTGLTELSNSWTLVP